MLEKHKVDFHRGEGFMVAEDRKCSRERDSAFRSEAQQRYWEQWIEQRGDSRKVAAILGVTRATVQEHIAEAARIAGYKNATDAKEQLGFIRKREGGVTARDLKRLLEMQGYRCALTGVRLRPDDAELDHKIPLSRGGLNDLSNLQWITKAANRAKGTMTDGEFIDLCYKVTSIRKCDGSL